MMQSRWILLALACSLLLGLGCRPGAEEEGRLVIMRIGHAAPIAGFDAYVQVLGADAEEETATVGVRCDEDAQEVLVTKGLPTAWVCGLGIRLEEVHVETISGDERAVSLRIWSEQFREQIEAEAHGEEPGASDEGEPEAAPEAPAEEAPSDDGPAEETPSADEPAEEAPAAEGADEGADEPAQEETAPEGAPTEESEAASP